MLSLIGHALIENSSELVVQNHLSRANAQFEGWAEMALILRVRLAADVGCGPRLERRDFVYDLRQAWVMPHVAQNSRSSAIDGRTQGTNATPFPESKLKPTPCGWPIKITNIAQSIICRKTVKLNK